MNECLICDKQKENAKSRCKVCGMKAGEYRYGNFIFCSAKCLDFFLTMAAKTDPVEMRKMAYNEVIF